MKYKLLLICLLLISFVFSYELNAEEFDEYVMDGIYLSTYDEFNLKVGDTFKIEVYQRLTNENIEDEDLRSIFGEKIEDAIFDVMTEPRNMASVDSNGLVTALGKCYGVVLVYTSDYQFMTTCTIVIDDAVMVWEGWHEEDGKYYWIENERIAGTEGQGKAIYDPKSDAWYWLDASDGGARSENKEIYIEEKRIWIRALEDGKLCRGWYEDSHGKQYFDLNNSARYHGEKVVDDITYYFDTNDGYLLDNEWLNIKNDYYWYEGGIRQGVDASKEIVIDGDTYWLDSSKKGARVSDIEIKRGDNYYRYDSDGKLIYGWFRNKLDKYYYDTNGKKVFGIYKIDGNYHYFDLVTGKLFNFGWVNNIYWFENTVKQGIFGDPKNVRDVNYGHIERGREVYDPDSDGWYWLDADNNGAKAINKEVWMPYIYQEEDNWDLNTIIRQSRASDYYTESTTKALMSIQIEEAIKNKSGKWVRYDENGKMYKGWVKLENWKEKPEQNGNTYYYDYKTGLMAKGKTIIDGKEYHFDEVSGVLID